MCAREGLRREGLPASEREEGEGVLEVAAVSRDGTDTPRADDSVAADLSRASCYSSYRLQAPTELVRLQLPSKTPLTATPLSLTDNSHFPRLPILNLWTSWLVKQAVVTQHRAGKNGTLQDSGRKGRFNLFAKMHQFFFNLCKRIQNGHLKHFQLSLSRGKCT